MLTALPRTEGYEKSELLAVLGHEQFASAERGSDGLIPAERRGEGLGLVGIVGGVPALVALPGGVWMATHWGFRPVFAATAAAALLVLVVLPGVPDQRGLDAGAPSVRSRLGKQALLRPAAIFSALTMAAGVLVTFVPLAIADGPPRWPRSRCLPSQRRPRSRAGPPGRPGTGAGTPGCSARGWPCPPRAWRPWPRRPVRCWSSPAPPRSG